MTPSSVSSTREPARGCCCRRRDDLGDGTDCTLPGEAVSGADCRRVLPNIAQARDPRHRTRGNASYAKACPASDQIVTAILPASGGGSSLAQQLPSSVRRLDAVADRRSHEGPRHDAYAPAISLLKGDPRSYSLLAVWRRTFPDVVIGNSPGSIRTTSCNRRPTSSSTRRLT